MSELSKGVVNNMKHCQGHFKRKNKAILQLFMITR